MKQESLSPPEWIYTSAALDEFCCYVRTVGSFGFDTEFVMESSYRTQICLVQIAAGPRVALVDPMGGLDLAPVWDLTTDPRIITIVHAGGEDLALCFRHAGVPPANVFDVQIAAGLVGMAYPISLMKLVWEIAGRRLHKSQTLTEWRARPLSQAQIDYARDDVGFLPVIHEKLTERLASLGRTHWAREEFARLERAESYVRAEADELTRLKGAGALDRQELAVARELMLVRERIAERLDRPPRVILKDYLLTEIAKHRWTDPGQIKTLRGLSLPSWGVQELAGAVRRALDAPKESWPALPPPNEESEEMTVLTALLTAVLRDHCNRHHFAYSLLTTKQQLNTIANDFLRRGDLEDMPAVLGPWRTEASGELIADVLHGRKRIRVLRKPRSCKLDLAP